MTKRNSPERKQELAQRRDRQSKKVSDKWWPSPGEKGNKYVPAGENKNIGGKVWG